MAKGSCMIWLGIPLKKVMVFIKEKLHHSEDTRAAQTYYQMTSGPCENVLIPSITKPYWYFGFSFCGDSWAFGFVRHLRELTPAVGLWLMRTTGTRQPWAVHNVLWCYNQYKPYLTLTCKARPAVHRGPFSFSWFTHTHTHVGAYTMSTDLNMTVLHIFLAPRRDGVRGVISLYTWLAARLETQPANQPL